MGRGGLALHHEHASLELKRLGVLHREHHHLNMRRGGHRKETCLPFPEHMGLGELFLILLLLLLLAKRQKTGINPPLTSSNGPQKTMCPEISGGTAYPLIVKRPLGPARLIRELPWLVPRSVKPIEILTACCTKKSRV